MIKKLTLMTILLLGNITFSQELKLVEKYLFATLKGKIDIDTLKNIMKENFKEGISNNGVIGKYFTNDFRIRYFDNKILCIEEYIDWF